MPRPANRPDASRIARRDRRRKPRRNSAVWNSARYYRALFHRITPYGVPLPETMRTAFPQCPFGTFHTNGMNMADAFIGPGNLSPFRYQKGFHWGFFASLTKSRHSFPLSAVFPAVVAGRHLQDSTARDVPQTYSDLR